MIDIITVVFQEELPVLRLQAQSINLYGQNIGQIYVIVNDDSMDVGDINTVWWGQYCNQVTVVHRTTWNVDYKEDGWLTQQLLKLLATNLCVNEWSMILDAKTLLVCPLPILANKPQVGLLDIYSVFDPSRKIVSELFNISITKQLGPGGVPFILHNKLTQEMIKVVERLTGLDFSTWFQQQGMVTEFILYSGYVLYKFGNFDSLYDTKKNAILPCNLCHSEVQMFDHKFKEMSIANTVSIHRNAWKKLTPGQQQDYQDFLTSRGIE
jgi:hypothetical protein